MEEVFTKTAVIKEGSDDMRAVEFIHGKKRITPYDDLVTCHTIGRGSLGVGPSNAKAEFSVYVFFKSRISKLVMYWSVPSMYMFVASQLTRVNHPIGFSIVRRNGKTEWSQCLAVLTLSLGVIFEMDRKEARHVFHGESAAYQRRVFPWQPSCF